jgi:carbon monoxide dehydrogenase subunit G
VRLEHEFSVPAPPDVVWAAVIDPERVAPCMPGASLTSVDGTEFSGGVKVKLGPVSLMYKGSGEFLETDEQARKVVIKASGKDSRGNGTAAATVTVTLSPEGDGTKGTVVTDLTVTGKPAQFGRGMIVEVSGKLLDTFAACLASKLGTNGEAAEEAKPAVAPAAVAPVAATVDAEDRPDDGTGEPPPPAKPKPATRRRAPAKAAQKSATGVSADVTDGAVAAEKPSSTELDTEVAASPHLSLVGEQESAPAAPATKPAPRQVNVTSETEAIDLMDYAGPTVAKRLIPAVLGLVAVLLLIRRLRRKS